MPPESLVALAIQQTHKTTLGMSSAERKTMVVAVASAAMMLVELIGGQLLGSMAVTADGLHMASHTLALGIAAFAYAYARRHASNPRFAFGTGKVNALGGYTGAAFLGLTALWMLWESVERAWSPALIHYGEAIGVAALGLAVNAWSAWLLWDDHGGHGHQGGACQHDFNLRAAYLHVVTDAATSVLAIMVLAAAWRWSLPWLDAVAGIAAACLVAWWSVSLLATCSSVLLDHQGPEELRQTIRATLEVDGDRVSDLRCWAVAPGRFALAISISTDVPRPVVHYRRKVAGYGQVAWVAIEVHA
jgi:cation diffusion facilitator family transporter